MLHPLFIIHNIVNRRGAEAQKKKYVCSVLIKSLWKHYLEHVYTMQPSQLNKQGQRVIVANTREYCSLTRFFSLRYLALNRRFHSEEQQLLKLSLFRQVSSILISFPAAGSGWAIFNPSGNFC